MIKPIVWGQVTPKEIVQALSNRSESRRNHLERAVALNIGR